MIRFVKLATAAAVLCTGANAANASDARSIALGGSVIANGKGVHGALSNPASLMAMQRRGELAHLRFGVTAELRDAGNTIDILTDSDNDNLIDDIEQEIDDLIGQPITCDPRVGFGSGDDICISGTQGLSDVAGQILDIMNAVDEEELEGYVATDLGMAYTRSSIPFAINLRGSVTASGTLDVADGDLAYVSEINTLLDDDSLTKDELESASFLDIDEANNSFVIIEPEDILESDGSGGGVIRTQLGVSLAKTIAVSGNAIDIGITPKISSLTASSVDIGLDEEFEDDTESAADRFDDNEVSETTFTVDVGASVRLKRAPVRLAAVIYNLIPESITTPSTATTDGIEFETTAQFVVGAQYQRGLLSLTGDIALNEAKQDNFETQKMGVGVEYGTRLLAVRAGIAHDAARTADATSLTLGLGLGALDIGGRITDTEGLEAGLQLSFTFM